MQTYRIYVRCHSTERFDVKARNASEAYDLYEKGKCTLEGDEVESRDTLYMLDNNGVEVSP